MSLVVIDYGAANLASVMFALDRLGADAILSRDPDVIGTADKILFPGVGAAKSSMENIQKLELNDCIQSLTQPVMGICMGMQLLFDYSEEGDTDMLGVIPDQVKHFDKREGHSVPHMGWNTINFNAETGLFKGLMPDSHFYFVHSYFAPVSEYSMATCDYANKFSAIIKHNNFYGCQFHPEKSGESGAKILQNFIKEDL